jgi:hypothetical protein
MNRTAPAQVMLCLTLVVAGHGAAAAAQPALEQRRDDLLREGVALRQRLVDSLRRAQELTMWDATLVLDRRARRVEKEARTLRLEFITHDERVSRLALDFATAAKPISYTPSGEPEFLLTEQKGNAINASHLWNQLEAVRAVQKDLGDTLTAQRTRAIALSALFVSAVSMTIAALSSGVSLVSRLRRRRTVEDWC